VPFDRVIAEDQQIKNLAAELKKELPGILNWAIKGLDRLNRNGGFTIPKAPAETPEEYRATFRVARPNSFDRACLGRFPGAGRHAQAALGHGTRNDLFLAKHVRQSNGRRSDENRQENMQDNVGREVGDHGGLQACNDPPIDLLRLRRSKRLGIRYSAHKISAGYLSCQRWVGRGALSWARYLASPTTCGRRLLRRFAPRNDIDGRCMSLRAKRGNL